MQSVHRSKAKPQDVPEFRIVENVIGPDAVRAYKEDGVVCLRNAISNDWLDVIELGIQQALQGASTNLDVVRKKGDQGQFSVSSQAWQNVEPFERFIFDSPVADLAWPFLESRYLCLYYDFLLIKEAHSENAATPWHQDHAYYPARGRKVINSWIALDPIPRSTALRFYRGSHQAGVLYRAVNFENQDHDYRHVRKDRPEVPDIDNDKGIEILNTAMEPGDMLIWNSYTLHCAPGNNLDRRRAAFSVNWLGDDVTYDEMPALETYLDAELVSGDRLISRKFPLVRGSVEA
ncbi:MAG: phytanoyl-CoA dioxygenase family protein [Gammaproteobacteria bacterium]|nr:phytanoyl-CoA dioxygenase family protein [Gammaproteobacteria bacterium]MDH3857642.1 phytanoyl-CoA dioxygenase family protein [Gammaproteobacteria bacterium]